MPKLVITKKKHGKLAMNIPHYIFINGQMLGLMKGKSVAINIPAATFEVKVQSMFKWFYSAAVVTTHTGTTTHIDFSDREKWWDMLFVADIILWCARRFLDLESPWTWIYEILTNGYFVAWLIYEWTIRKRYFRLDIYEKVSDKNTTINTSGL